MANFQWTRKAGSNAVKYLVAGVVPVAGIVFKRRSNTWMYTWHLYVPEPLPHTKHIRMHGVADSEPQAKRRAEEAFCKWCDLADAGTPHILREERAA